jgi:hypothetical protein
MRKSDLVTFVLCTAAVAIAIVGGGVASASGSSRTLAAGPHIPKDGGEVQFTGYSNNDGPKSVAVLTGAIGDYGEAIRTTNTGSTGTQYNELELSMTRGSFRLNIADIESELGRAIYGAFPTSSRTCSGEVTVAGATPVVSGAGTGAYKGLQGSLHMTITINEVEDWPTCPKTDTSPFLAQSVFITGSGTVSLR